MSQREAATVAKINENTVSKALRKPHVAAKLEELKSLAALEVASLKKMAKGLAIREGIRLMRESKSDAVRARMVEFFAGEDRSAPSVQVNIGAAAGYEYVRPGSRIVDVTPTTPDE
jgi:hypothetical protein